MGYTMSHNLKEIDGNGWCNIMCNAFDCLLADANESCSPAEYELFVRHVIAELGGTKACAETYEAQMLREVRDMLADCHALEDEVSRRRVDWQRMKAWLDENRARKSVGWMMQSALEEMDRIDREAGR